MIAEIHNKLNGSLIYSIERLEDELTGNFFGTLRYLPFTRGIQRILLKYAYSENLEFQRILNSITADEFDIEFWKRSEDNREIDAVLEVADVAIGIEVKYNSGLSGDEQLSIEAGMMNEWYGKQKKLLLFVAREEEAKKIYDTHKDILTNVCFGYLTWQNALLGLNEIIATSIFEERIVSDLKELLEHKGFMSFIGFQDVCGDVEIEKALFFAFENDEQEVFYNGIENIEILPDLYFRFEDKEEPYL